MENTLQELKDRLSTMTDVNSAASILNWDQATMLPDGAAEQRGRQMATLGKLSHEILTSEQTGKLISNLTPWSTKLPEHDHRHIYIREAKRIRDLEVQVPSKLNGEMTEHYSKIYAAWTQARPQNDFELIRPLLEKSVDLSRKFADCFSGMEHPLDSLIQYSDMGVTVNSTKLMFEDLRKDLVPLVKKVAVAKQNDSSCLLGDFDEQAQLDFCKTVAERLGYDFQRGRMDLSPHPFMTRLSGNDVRITTRARRDDLTDCLFSVILEVGHAIYELGINPELDGNILGGGVSNGVHESQSRLWENCVGRSEGFWTYFYPILKSKFSHFDHVPLDAFMKAINKVEPGLIRVDADELTYNLHVMIRFDLECQLIEGTLKAKDLPEAWNARYLNDLGQTVPNNANGCLQDVHWYSGRLGGAFQGYTIGNILSAQFYNAAKSDIPNLENDFKIGNFSRLKSWLNNNIHFGGASSTPDKLVLNSTKEPMNIRHYMTYLNAKYSRLYNLS